MLLRSIIINRLEWASNCFTTFHVVISITACDVLESISLIKSNLVFIVCWQYLSRRSFMHTFLIVTAIINIIIRSMDRFRLYCIGCLQFRCLNEISESIFDIFHFFIATASFLKNNPSLANPFLPLTFLFLTSRCEECATPMLLSLFPSSNKLSLIRPTQIATSKAKLPRLNRNKSINKFKE